MNRIGPRGKRRILFYGALYPLFLLFAVGCPLTDRLTLHPSRHKINPAGATRHTLTWNGDDTLEIWRDAPNRLPEKPAYVLEFTGNATRAEEIAGYATQAWEGRATEVWSVNYPGFGGSTGPARLKSNATTALLAYDELRRVAGPDARIYVSGQSMGSVNALHVAANRPVAGVYLVNPPAVREIILGDFGWWNLWLIAGPVSWGVPKEADSLANGKRCTAPAVILTAGHDTVVRPKYQRRVAEAYAGPKRVIDLAKSTHETPLDEAARRQRDEAFEAMFE